MATVPAPAAPQATAGAVPAALWQRTGLSAWPIGALVVLLLLQLSLVFTRAINWDEFFFWHEVARFAGGQLDRPLQTFHVRLFGWLPITHANSVDGIVTARLFMLACELVTIAAIAILVRRFADWQTGVFAGLLYLSAGYVLQHGMSFRVDPMLAATLMAALAILGTSRLRIGHLVAFGLLCALAGMLSMKAVLYVPAFVALAWLRWSESGFASERLLQLAGGGAATVVAFTLLYAWHSTGLAEAADTVGQGGQMIGSSGGWMFFVGLPAYGRMALKSMAMAPVLYACLLAAPVLIARARASLTTKVALAGLWLPITSLFFYTNTAAYFYAFILPPVVVASCLPLRWGLTRFGPRAVTFALLATALGVGLTEDRIVIDRQRQIIDNVQRIFPQPVTYIDHNFMLGDWPKANGFMTPWGMSSYYAAGEATYRAALERQTVPMILANSDDLLAMLEGEDGLLVPADAAAIRNNFQLFSWPIWIAGKHYAPTSGELADEFLVPGEYTLHGGPLVLDGQRHDDGSLVSIRRGLHRVENPGSGPVDLVWGDNLLPPARPLQPGPINVDF